MAERLSSRRLDAIRSAIETGAPHLGPETEGIVVDSQTFEVLHTLAGQQPTTAIRRWLKEKGGAIAALADEVVPDVP